jgi:hypothetical protein
VWVVGHSGIPFSCACPGGQRRDGRRRCLRVGWHRVRSNCWGERVSRKLHRARTWSSLRLSARAVVAVLQHRPKEDSCWLGVYPTPAPLPGEAWRAGLVGTLKQPMISDSDACGRSGPAPSTQKRSRCSTRRTK